jgi:xanthine dehydrogenase large subunit
MNRITDAPFVLSAAAHKAGAVGIDHAHESAHLHVAGTAAYVDDLPELAGTLHAALGLSPVAHGRLKGIRFDALRALPGVVEVLGAEHIPGENQ